MNTNLHLPRWAYITLGLACIPMGFWASYITLEYFKHGAAALETDPALRALALSAALMFVASEMAAFALAALLSERQLWARRWMLTGFAAAVLLLEVCTIVAVQLALTAGADMSQSTVQTQEADLRKRIAALEAGAAAKRATAEKQRATARDAYELRLSAKSSDGATAEQAKTAALYEELARVQSQKHPTLVGLLGEKYALAYAVARGILVSLGGLVFFGTAGALLRAARSVSGAVSGTVAPAQTAAPGATRAPAGPSFKQAGAVVPKDAPTGFSYGSKTSLAGAGVLAAMAAPMAHAAPHAPAVPAAAGAPAGEAKQSHLTAAKPSHSTQAQQAHTGTPAAAEPAGLGEAKQPHLNAAKPPHLDSASASETAALKRTWNATVVPDGTKLDTGTSGKAATRYNRIKAAVKAGKLKPSMRAIQTAEGGGGVVVRAYLRQLETEGVTVRAGRGWVLASKGGAA